MKFIFQRIDPPALLFEKLGIGTQEHREVFHLLPVGIPDNQFVEEGNGILMGGKPNFWGEAGKDLRGHDGGKFEREEGKAQSDIEEGSSAFS